MMSASYRVRKTVATRPPLPIPTRALRAWLETTQNNVKNSGTCKGFTAFKYLLHVSARGGMGNFGNFCWYLKVTVSAFGFGGSCRSSRGGELEREALTATTVPSTAVPLVVAVVIFFYFFFLFLFFLFFLPF